MNKKTGVAGVEDIGAAEIKVNAVRDTTGGFMQGMGEG